MTNPKHTTVAACEFATGHAICPTCGAMTPDLCGDTPVPVETPSEPVDTLPASEATPTPVAAPQALTKHRKGRKG